ncbi:MAG: hypothetical protein NTU53_07890 [Planctomycetota bacterium]|nr:hypothetical protein [Planctomycetota bacterium]
MMTRIALGFALALGIATVCSAVPSWPFTTTDALIDRAKDIVIAKILSNGPGLPDDLSIAEVNITTVIKGDRTPGKAAVATRLRDGLEPGKNYMLINLGGLVGHADFVAIQELGAVEVPPGFDLKNLDGQTAKNQALMVLKVRRIAVLQQLLRLEAEKNLLDKAVPEKMRSEAAGI